MSGAADERLAAIVLAGGAGTRVGGADKGLLAFRGAPLIERALAFLADENVANVVISANRNLDRYSRYACRVVTDRSDAFDGPLAGIASALAVLDAPYVFTLPVDAPDLPHGLVHALLAALIEPAAPTIDVAVAHDGEFRQPLCAVYRRLAVSQAQAALREGRRSVREFQDTLRHREVRFGSPAAYRNLNELEQYA